MALTDGERSGFWQLVQLGLFAVLAQVALSLYSLHGVPPGAIVEELNYQIGAAGLAILVSFIGIGISCRVVRQTMVGSRCWHVGALALILGWALQVGAFFVGLDVFDHIRRHIGALVR